MEKSYSNRNPPKFDETISYEAWKTDVEIWQELTELPKNKQALAIHLSLSGKARQASTEVGVVNLKKEDGVQCLIKKLDELFLLDKGRRQFLAFQNLYKFKRSSDTSVGEFVNEFERIYFRFTQEDMKLPDAVMAFMLLVACDLSEQNFQLAMSATTDVSYDNVKGTLKRVFGSGFGASKETFDYSQCHIKAEPVFQSNSMEDEEVYYNSARRRNRGGGARFGGTNRGRQYYRGNVRSSTEYASQRYNQRDDQQGGRSERSLAPNGAARKLNPPDASGQPSRCLICDSRYHWARNCPHSYESAFQESEVNEMPETVHLSLLGTDLKQYHKNLDMLLGESLGSVVLDSGCSKTVCGKQWLEYYLDTLSSAQRDKIREEKTSSTFRFGDGKTCASLKRVVIPCVIADFNSTIRTDVVDCNIPLLLSKEAMKRAKMQINFECDTVEVLGRTVDLTTTTSGHYCLPISQ